ncbi:MAG: helix-turn-helix transcriptional regulator [Saccharospirillaceae bacterium]|nr:helix-turn-helix transcriptional regulator [Saccharospirillaceae bacterium]MCD8531239.1 helix-turn-helix transcriptional regulator [Saccharospirillaceae bacterium]
MNTSAGNLSQIMDDLVNALRFDYGQNVDWFSWLHQLNHACNSDSAKITISSSDNKYHFITHTVADTNQINTEHDELYARQWIEGSEKIELLLRFNKNQWSTDTLVNLAKTEPMIRSCILLALQHQQLLNRKTFNINMACLSELGIFHLDHQGKMISCNAQGESLLKKGSIQQGPHGNIIIGDRSISDYLSAALDSETISFTEQNNQADYEYEITYLPAEKSCWPNRMATFNLKVRPRFRSMDHNWIMNTFSLTENQARVAALSCCGYSASEIAKETGLKTNTVYSYLKAIYKKMGINSISKLSTTLWQKYIF